MILKSSFFKKDLYHQRVVKPPDSYSSEGFSAVAYFAFFTFTDKGSVFRVLTVILNRTGGHSDDPHQVSNRK